MLRRVFTPTLCCAAAGRSVHCGRAGAKEPSGDRGVGGQGGGLCGPGRAHPRGAQPTHPRRPHPLSTLKPALYPQSQPSGYPQLRSIANPKPLRDQPGLRLPHTCTRHPHIPPTLPSEADPQATLSQVLFRPAHLPPIKRISLCASSRQDGEEPSSGGEWPGFMPAFLDKGRQRPLASRIPVHLVLNEDIGQQGRCPLQSAEPSRGLWLRICVWTSSKRLVLAVVGSCF